MITPRAVGEASRLSAAEATPPSAPNSIWIVVTTAEARPAISGRGWIASWTAFGKTRPNAEMKTITNMATTTADPAPPRPTANKASAATQSSASPVSSNVFAVMWRLSNQALTEEPTITPDPASANRAANADFDTP